jgi:hypothetical protein
MQEDLQKIEEISRRLGISYEEAHYALEEAGGDLADALVIAERDRETAGAGVMAAGLSFIDELKKLIAGGEICALRFKFGGRTVKEIPITPATALGVIGIATLAVVLTKLRVEVLRAQEGSAPAQVPGYEDVP